MEEKLFTLTDMWTAWYTASFREKAETTSEHFNLFIKEEYGINPPEDTSDKPKNY